MQKLYLISSKVRTSPFNRTVGAEASKEAWYSLHNEFQANCQENPIEQARQTRVDFKNSLAGGSENNLASRR